MWIRYMCYSNQHMLERNHKLIIEIMFKASRCFHKMNPTQNVSITFARMKHIAMYNHLGLKFTSTSQVAAHIVSEQKQKPPVLTLFRSNNKNPSGSLTVGTCNSIAHQWRSASWGGTEDPVVSTSCAVKNWSLIYIYIVIFYCFYL